MLITKNIKYFENSSKKYYETFKDFLQSQRNDNFVFPFCSANAPDTTAREKFMRKTDQYLDFPNSLNQFFKLIPAQRIT